MSSGPVSRSVLAAAVAGTEPVHVLHVRIATGTGGGPEKTILASPRHLENTRYRASVLYLHPPGDVGHEVLRRRAAEQRCPLTSIPERLPLDPRTLVRIAAHCRRERVRIWHGHDYKSNLFGVLLAPALGLQLVTTVHGWVRHTSRTPLYYAIDRLAIRRYDQVVCVSADLERTCRELGIKERKLSLIENAIDTEYFRRRTERAPLQGRPLVIGAAGRLSEEKGFGFLIEAVEALLDAGHDLELRIAGEGELETRLRARMASSRHAARLKLLGFVEDTRALFESFDVFALSSLREGLPNVVLEAMAMEVPVLATRSGGIDAFARDGEDALLVETGSSEALRGGLERLVRDEELRRRLASTARARIETDCSFERRMRRMVEVYERLPGPIPAL